MHPSSFRKDAWLRTSAYHLATWSLAALAIELIAAGSSQGGGALWPKAVMIVGASVMTGFTTERRIAKMVGPAGEPLVAAAGQMWVLAIASLIVASTTLAIASLEELVVSIWLAGTGAMLVWWGRRADFAWYAGLGAMMLAAGLADAAVATTGGWRLGLRVLVLGLAIPAAAVATNRRFLWFRPGQ